MEVGITTDIANQLHIFSALAVASTPIHARLQDILTAVSEILAIPCSILLVVDDFLSLPKYSLGGKDAALVQKLQNLPDTENGRNFIESLSSINDPVFFQQHSPVFAHTLKEVEDKLEFVGITLFVGKQKLGKLVFLTPHSEALYNEKKAVINVVSPQITLLLMLLDTAQAESKKESQPTINGLSSEEVLATLSHELRTPLNSILGWVSLLQNPTTDKKLWQQALDSIERSARTQSLIINELLDASYSFKEQITLNKRPVLISSIIRQVVDSLRPEAELKGVTLQATIETSTDYVFADPERLTQIIWHLLTNAIKFTPKDGKIQVETTCKNKEIEITISDSGIGINPEFLPYVFDPFRQEESNTTRKFGGLGLGLAIVRHQAELHGGVVEAKSAGKNRGTTLAIRLPLMSAENLQFEAGSEALPSSPHSALPPKTSSLKNLNGVRILVVDDDDDSLAMVSSILNSCNAKVQTASNAAQALTIFEQWKPDILISDLQMPGIDGFELIRRIRHQEINFHQRMAAIALTAYTRAEDRVRVLASGFQTHLPKPIVPAELVAVVNSFVINPGEKMSLC